MIEIPIFKAEREIPGLADNIAKSRCLAYVAPAELQTLENSGLSAQLMERMKAIATNLNQPDLYYLKSILVTVGWNANNDVFDPIEVWKSRYTAEDKQINFEHNEKDIIGHMTASYAMDDEGKQLGDDLSIDNLPNKFHIVNGGVLYKKWEDSKLLDRMDTIIRDIAKGEIFVSMEALFSNFDYAIKEEDGTQSLISRNKETAFLTKHLKVYGGTGVYNNREIGRVLRNITFSGKGIVKRPANRESIIFRDVQPFAGKSKNSEILGDNKTMSVETAELVALKDKLDAALAGLESIRKERDEAKAKAEAEAKAAVENELKSLKSQLATKETELAAANDKTSKLDSESKTKVDELNKTIASLNTKNEEVEQRAKAAEDQIAKAKAEAKKIAREGALKAAGKTDAEIVELSTALAGLDDAAFETTVKALKVEVKKEEATTTVSDALKSAASTTTNTVTGGETPDESADLLKGFASLFQKNLKTTASLKTAE